MIDIINIAAMLATIGLGLIGWLAPDYTMKVLDLSAGPSNRGKSEIRAASGALFVGIAGAALIISQPLAFAMVGFLYLGAGTGRITSIIVDGSGDRTIWIFFLCEWALAAWLILANLSIF
ncbi:MAG: DUF4345 family protein [Pseudomonadota bacterium]